MKKARIHPMVLVASVFASLLIGFFAGRNMNRTPVQIQTLTAPVSTTAAVMSTDAAAEPGLININTATLAELQTLPGIGETFARRIIEYREANGPFQTVGELMNVDGIGEKRLEALWDLVTTGG